MIDVLCRFLLVSQLTWIQVFSHGYRCQGISAFLCHFLAPDDHFPPTQLLPRNKFDEANIIPRQPRAPHHTPKIFRYAKMTANRGITALFLSGVRLESYFLPSGSSPQHIFLFSNRPCEYWTDFAACYVCVSVVKFHQVR